METKINDHISTLKFKTKSIFLNAGDTFIPNYIINLNVGEQDESE
jgi:hypothetical protein